MFIPRHVVDHHMCVWCPARFLSDEDDGVSETVIEFAVQYIGVLKVGLCFLNESLVFPACIFPY